MEPYGPVTALVKSQALRVESSVTTLIAGVCVDPEVSECTFILMMGFRVPESSRMREFIALYRTGLEVGDLIVNASEVPGEVIVQVHYKADFTSISERDLGHLIVHFFEFGDRVTPALIKECGGFSYRAKLAAPEFRHY